MDKDNNIHKLINDNIILITNGYKKYKYTVLPYHRDELLSMSNYSLFKTASIFNESRGVKFSTLFYTILKNEIRKFYRDRNSSSRMSIYGEDISLSAKLNDNDDMDIESCLFNNIDIDSNLLFNENLRLLITNLGERELNVLRLRYNNPNFTHKEIGEKLGIGRWTVNRILKSIKCKYKLISNGVLFKPCPDKLIFKDYKDIIKNYDFKNNTILYL